MLLIERSESGNHISQNIEVNLHTLMCIEIGKQQLHIEVASSTTHAEDGGIHIVNSQLHCCNGVDETELKVVVTMETNRHIGIFANFLIDTSNILGSHATKAIHHTEEVAPAIEDSQLLQELGIFRAPFAHVHHVKAYLKAHSLYCLSQYNGTIEVLWVDSNTNHIHKTDNRFEEQVKILRLCALLVEHHVKLLGASLTNMLQYAHRTVAKLAQIFLCRVVSIAQLQIVDRQDIHGMNVSINCR